MLLTIRVASPIRPDRSHMSLPHPVQLLDHCMYGLLVKLPHGIHCPKSLRLQVGGARGDSLEKLVTCLACVMTSVFALDCVKMDRYSVAPRLACSRHNRTHAPFCQWLLLGR